MEPTPNINLTAAQALETEQSFRDHSPQNPSGLKAKFDAKKARKREKREQDLVALGVAPDRAKQVIARREYDAAPLAERLRRLEQMTAGAIQGIAEDLNALKHNDSAISEAIDINFRAFSKALEKIGVTGEQQRQLVEEAKMEIDAELAVRDAQAQAAAEAEQKAQIDAQEKAQVTAAVDVAGDTPPPHEDAVVFGG